MIILKLEFKIPTKIYFERNCIRHQSEVIGKIGRRAMIVTGRHSASACGALDDVTACLKSCGIAYFIFSSVENNPSVETIETAGKMAVEGKIDFVIGIGGGSPLDASKAIAVLAANPDLTVLDLFHSAFTKALPIVCIPTTAGTGSEVTPYSVLLRKDLMTKVSFGNEYTYPSYAFVDPKYTSSLSKESTINTAVDAFTHAFEGYLANRSTVLSDCLALEAISTFGKSMNHLAEYQLTDQDRDNLMLVSLLGGMIIAQTGVTIAHGMGYCYTYFKGIPHGKANGLIMREYIPLNMDCASTKIKKAMDALGCKSTDEFLAILHRMIGDAPHLTQEEIDQYTEITMLQKGSVQNTAHPINQDEIRKLWTRLA